MATEKQAVSGARVVKEIPLKEITIVEGFNARKDLGGDDTKDGAVKEDTRATIEQLADLIARQGQETPVRVWEDGGKFKLISGFRRYNALKLLTERKVTPKGASGPGVIFAEVVKGASEREVKLSNLVENMVRNNLQPFEIADAIVEMRDKYGMTGDVLATELAKSKGYINNLIRILEKVDPRILAVWRDPNNPHAKACKTDNLAAWAKLKHDEQWKEFLSKTGQSQGDGTKGEGKPRPGGNVKKPKESVMKELIQSIKDSRVWGKDEKLAAIQVAMFAMGHKPSVAGGSKGTGVVFDPRVEDSEEEEEDILEFDPKMFD